MKVSPDTSAVQTNDETLRFQATPNQLIALADRQAREALRSWVCRNVAFAYEANRALACYETKNLSDYSDDLGADTFMVMDSEQENGSVLCGKEWCLCDPTREAAETCWHSLAVRLLLCFRANHALAWQKQEQRLQAEAQPTQAQPKQPEAAPRPEAPEETPATDYDLDQHPPDKPIPGCARWRWTAGKLPKKSTQREDQQTSGGPVALIIKTLLN